MRTIEKPHAGDCPVCLAEVHPDAQVCVACGAEKIVVDDGRGAAAGWIGAVGILMALASGLIMLLLHEFSLLLTVGGGLWMRYGMANHLAKTHKARTSREAWRHVSAADAVDASRRAEAAARTAASAATSAAITTQIHGRR